MCLIIVYFMILLYFIKNKSKSVKHETFDLLNLNGGVFHKNKTGLLYLFLPRSINTKKEGF